MVSPFAPNPGSAESQTHNEKSSDPPTNVAARQQDNNTKSKQNTNENPLFDSRNPYSQHYQSNATIWALYLKETEAEDKELAQLWQIGLDQLLIFAGLFGAILTAFLIESRKNLKEDPLQAILQVLRNDSTPTISVPFKPSRSSLAVNATWFSSLGLTLISALTAVLARGWLAKYTPATPGMRSNDACERHLRYLRAQQWRLGIVVTGIPFLIQVALFLFAIGLVILTLNDNLGIGITLFVFTVLTTALYFFSTILPWFSPACPFQTTMSDFIPGIATKPRYPDSVSRKIYSPTPSKPLSLRERISLQWKTFNDFLIETHRKPERLETEANILAWMLTSTTKDDAMEEAVKAVAGANPSQHLRDALEKYGASRFLVDRFARCVKVVPGLPITGDERRAEAYLYAMLRIVEPSGEGIQDNDSVSFMRESLLQVGQPLHRWEDYMDYLQPLAFALRTKILLASGCDDDNLHWKRLKRDLMKMSTMGLAPYTRWVLLNATVEGLLRGQKHVRKMSAVVLAKQLQIPDTRYMLGKGDHGDEVVLEMAEILKESGDLNILEGLLRMARCSKFKNSISAVVCKIVSLLNHEEKDVRVAAEDALLKLMEKAELQELISIAIPHIIHIIKDGNRQACMAGSDTLWKLSKQVGCRPFIETALTEIIPLLKESNEYICGAGINVLWKLSEHAEFRPLIGTLIPDIVKHLNDSRRRNVWKESANALCNLSVYAEFRPLLHTGISEIIILLTDNEKDFGRKGVDALSKLADHTEFQPLIGTAIPQIITLLKDNNHWAAADTLLKLSNHTEFLPLIKTVIPEIITLLKDSDGHGYVREAAAHILLKLSKQAEFQPLIGTLIPEIIEHLNDDSQSVYEGLTFLSTLAVYAKFQPLIGTAIPEIITMIKNGNKNYVQRPGLCDLLKLSDHTEFRPLIGPIIPEMIAWLTADHLAQSQGAGALSKLSEYAEFQPLIKTAIPQITALLKDSDNYVRAEAADALSKLAEQAEFQPLIETAIPQIITLLKDSDNYVRKGTVDALSKLSEHAKFQSYIATAIPDIITLLKDSVPYVREAGAYTVLKLSDHTAFQTLIGTASVLSELISLLKDNKNASISAKILSKLSKLAEHKSVIANAIWSVLRHNDSSQFSANHEKAKGNGSVDGITVGGDAVHLMSYWINENRFDIASGVCILAKLYDYAQMCDSQILADFCISHALSKSARTCAELNVILRLSEHDRTSNFQRSTIIKVPDITELLKDDDKKIRRAATKALVKLSEQAEFRPLIKTAIPEIITFLKHHHWYVRETGACILSKISGYAEFQHLIGTAVPELTTMLKDSDMCAQMAGVNALSKLSEQVEFQSLIGTVIPEIIPLLRSWDSGMQKEGADILSKLSEQAELQPLIAAVIPEIITSLKGSNGYVQLGDAHALSKFSEQTKFWPLIETAIPEIIALLRESNMIGRVAGTHALLKFSEQTEFQPFIGAVIPEIISLLKYSDKYAWKAGTNAILKLSEYAELQPMIGSLIPDFITHLNSNSRASKLEAAYGLSKLSANAEFQPLIGPAIPGIIALLRDRDRNVQRAGADALSKISEQTEFQPLIGAAIPDIISLLKDSNRNFWPAGADVLSKLSIHAEFRSLIGTAISDIIALLKDSVEDVQKPAFRPLMMKSFGEVYLSSKEYVQKAGADALSKLSEHAEFQPLIINAIPEIVNLLKASSKHVRQAGADALLKLSKQNYFLHCHQDFFPAIIAILLSSNTPLDIVPICTHIFAHYAFNDYFCDKIVQILVFAFDCLYFPDGTHRCRGLSVIKVIAEYATLIPILHEIWTIYSFTNNILPGVGLEQTKFFVGQMETYGLLKTL